MRASYRFRDSQKSISNWSVFLPLHDSNPAVAVVGGKNIVIAVDKTVTEPRIPTNIVPLDDSGIILAYVACRGDAPFLVKKVQLEIEECERFPKYSFPISPQYVACKVADVHRQLDCLGRNPYFLLTLIVGFKPCTLSPELWVADPSGMVRKCPAHAIGRDFELRNEFLRKNYNYQESSVQSAVNLAIRALLEGSENGEKKIEVTVKTREHGLTQFKQAEIDAIVAEIEEEKVASEKEAIILLLKSRSRKQLPREQLPKKLLPREQLPRKLPPRELLLRRQLPRKSKKSYEKNRCLLKRH